MFTFNSVSSDDFGISVIDFRQPILPSYQVNTVEAPARHGAFIGKKNKLAAKTIQVEVFIKADSETDLRLKVREIAAWLYTQEVKPLTYDFESDKTYYAILQGDTDLQEVLKYGRGTINFLCPDPFAYGDVIDSALGASVTYLGTAPTYPTYTVTFSASASNWQLTQGSGQYIKVVDNFIAGDVLVINTQTGKITVNGQLSLNILDFNSVFFPLEKGVNTLTVTPSSVSTTNINYTEKWL